MQAPMRRCFVHVGPPKTGTSYLQSVLWASRVELANQRLVLPLEQRDHYHIALALRGIAKATAAAGTATVLDRLTAAAVATRDADLLITQEQLAPATAAEATQLVSMLAPYEVHVVLTARDLGRQIPSGWQQSVKKRQILGYDDFLTAVIDRQPAADDFWSKQDLTAVAARWSSAVPPVRVHIVTVPAQGAPAGILLDRFCSVLGVDPARLHTSVAVTNSSLGHVQAELLRRVNEVLAADSFDAATPAAWAGQNYLAKSVLAAQPGPPPELPVHLHEWCEHQSHLMVDGLRAGGYAIAGSLDDLLPVFATSAGVPPPSDADVVSAAVHALATVVTQRHSDSERIKSARERVRRSTPDLLLPPDDAAANR